MDVVDLDMDDMFGPDDEAIEDNRYNNEELGVTSEGHGNEDEGKPVKVKRIVRNPQPKMDADRLTSSKGMFALLKDFENLQFKGKGYESEDLDNLLQILELWGHRMFPKLSFADLLERVEKLGTKRPVQVCLNKIRMDMPILDNDFVNCQDDDGDNIAREGDAERAFDELKDSADLNTSTKETNQNSAQTDTQLLSVTATESTLTNDQRELIERNRQIALEKRMARLKEKTETSIVAPPQAKPGASVSENEIQQTEEELFALLDGDMDW